MLHNNEVVTGDSMFVLRGGGGGGGGPQAGPSHTSTCKCCNENLTLYILQCANQNMAAAKFLTQLHGYKHTDDYYVQPWLLRTTMVTFTIHNLSWKCEVSILEQVSQKLALHVL